MEDACTNVTHAARLVQLLKIQGFSATKCMTTCRYGHNYIPSRWTVDGYEWEVRIYPGMARSSDNRNLLVALTISCCSKPRGSGVEASLACRLIDPSGKLEPSQGGSASGTFYNQEECRDLVFLGRRDDLAGYLKDDTLTIQCAIAVLKPLPLPRIPAEEVPVPSSNLHQHLGEILQSKMGSDVTFLVCNESFRAHKSVLAARSPVFKAQFFGEMKEKSSRRVEIMDMEPDAFRAMLHFIYTDTVPELEKQEEASTVMAQHLLAAADRYGVDRLKLICEAKLSRGITVDTAATTLALAKQHNCSQLKVKCGKFIVRTPEILDAVLTTEGYKHLEASCPLVLTELLKSVHGRNAES
ncbi:BTB/POZ and MATH domain-containing protein 1-like [Hordeum vulgare subsp. vulgare]|uniref:BTB domain-containing protein n=1 Tax=Hordeum vulgare subsp. vulgare TaxID=112509 RepID=A0A8I6YIW2_HORVV|nr:BTB/POZ and MATH domain-containing protein 1-like [Hordeum vulgare subsp. vulgare]